MEKEISEIIVEFIKEREGKINFKELKIKTGLSTRELDNFLLELKLEGKIIQLNDKYSLFPNDLLIGEISTTLSGNNVIFYEGMMYPIDELSFSSVLLNDVVAFKIENNKATIISILDRRIKNITCEVIIEDGVKKIIPYHKNIEVSLDKSDMKELLDGDIILVDIDVNSDDEYCNAVLVKKLDIKNSPNRNEIEIGINYGFDLDYSDEYMEELSRIPKDTANEDISDRVDYRNLLTMTIDGIYTKDMDDAISVSVLEDDIIRVYVHISDVSHYVKPGTKLFERACDKTTSLYLNNSVFHMFHHILSNGICSLNQGEDRLTKTVIMDIDKYGNIVNSDIVKSVINSNKKMTYEDVDLIFNEQNIPFGYENFINELHLLNIASIRIRERMDKDGAINFASNELEKVYDDDGKLKSYRYMGESPARKLIEYLMISANEEVAKFLEYSPLPGVFRIHEYPELKKVNEAIRNLNELGKRIRPLKELDNSYSIQKIQKSLEKDEDYQILSTVLLKFMKRARYSIMNTGHFALALDHYTHFTSPIRRLPDLLVHMLLDVMLLNPERIMDINMEKLEFDLSKLCDRASYMSRRADQAELDAEKTSIIENMSNNIGEEFECVVLETANCIKIRINTIDIKVNNNAFENTFKYDKKRKLYYDMVNSLYMKMGTKVRVRLNSVNPINKSLGITILEVIDPNKQNIEKMTKVKKIV